MGQIHVHLHERSGFPSFAYMQPQFDSRWTTLQLTVHGNHKRAVPPQHRTTRLSRTWAAEDGRSRTALKCPESFDLHPCRRRTSRPSWEQGVQEGEGWHGGAHSSNSMLLRVEEMGWLGKVRSPSLLILELDSFRLPNRGRRRPSEANAESDTRWHPSITRLRSRAAEGGFFWGGYEFKHEACT